MKRHHPGLPWPRARQRDQVACAFCDALQPAPRLREGEAAYCVNCGEVLFQNRPRSLSRAVGFALAAAVFMIIALSFPFLGMSAAGSRTILSLSACVEALAADGDLLLALMCAVFTILAPLTLIGVLLYLCVPLLAGRALPGSKPLARLLVATAPWSMLEVFLLGFIVSLLKLGDVAEIEFQIGLWALVAVVLSLGGATAGMDRRELWDRLEVASLP